MAPEDQCVMEEEDTSSGSATETLSCSTGDNDTIPSQERELMYQEHLAHIAWAYAWIEREERRRKLQLERETCVASRT
eukprot:680553-Rhodomonas_salina.1